MIKRHLYILLVFLVTSVFGQTKLFLKKGHKKVYLKPSHTIGIITATDTFKYEAYPALWTIDSIGLNALTIKSSNNYRTINYNNILSIQYARRDQTVRCAYCFFASIFVIIAPFVSWENGKFQPAIFIPLMIIGIVPPLLTILSVQRNKLKTYKMGEWILLTK